LGSEVELKILLDAGQAKKLRARAAALARDGKNISNQSLTAVYFDTVDRALARRKIALRVRKEGRRWVQTLKIGSGVIGGLSRVEEWESPAPGGRLDLDRFLDPEARALVEAALDGAPLGPVFETAFRRAALALAGPHGAAVELAIDVGEIRAGGRAAPLAEAELELKAGDPRDLFALGKALFPEGPLRFSRRNKAARGFALADGGVAVDPVPPVVKGAPVALTPAQTTEAAARDVLRACLDQIAGNAAAAAVSDDPEGAHQLRVGLRRLRTAAALFREALGGPALSALEAEAKALADAAGAARDLDVLSEEWLAPMEAAESSVESGAVAPGVAALRAALDLQRAEKRAALRARLAAPETVAFLFDLGGFVEGRGWLRPADFGQTEALAAPVAETARAALDARWRKAGKLGRVIETLDEAARHELRKRLKKLRYAIEFFTSLYPEKMTKPFLKRLKALQDDFGALQDLATARLILLGPDAPAADDPAAQRAAGYALGRWEATADAAFASARTHWAALAREGPFWR
jgi:inorganic triphosphatase YgiF